MLPPRTPEIRTQVNTKQVANVIFASFIVNSSKNGMRVFRSHEQGPGPRYRLYIIGKWSRIFISTRGLFISNLLSFLFSLRSLIYTHTEQCRRIYACSICFNADVDQDGGANSATNVNRTLDASMAIVINHTNVSATPTGAECCATKVRIFIIY